MRKITFGLIQKIIQVLHCKSFKRGATKHYKNVSMPAYKSSLASVILEKSICTCETIPLATWIQLILYVNQVSTPPRFKRCLEFGLTLISYIISLLKSTTLSDAN
ncbi:suppression of tumorigenicity 5 protein [Platysternon megacephalum]|uniref:Suppression of tumorigenicity 5 protein n=1 Tax=Platysternon megacephalum TaxID=55544 RepID=A0A4D9DZH5_9SAUR|nr:suppression of tumorigenicity 5 protein [Platysternon megacephalum]